MREARPPGKGQSRRAHRAEPKRHDSLFRALIATAVDGIVVIDERGGIQVFNAACEKLFGYSAQDVLGQNVNVLMPEPYRSSHDSYLTHFRETGEERIIGIGREVRGRHKTGETFPMYLSVGEGEIEGERFFVGIIHDLTAIRTEEERGLALDRHLASIVESSDDIILSKDLDGTILTWNQAATQIFGWTAAEMIGASIERIIPEDRRDEEKQMVSRIRAGGKVDHFETVRVRKDGSQVAVSLSISPVRDAKGTIVGASKIARDITAQRRAEAEKQRLQAELAHVARTNAMGQLSSALAHELNQPLTASMNYVNA
ncbi:MAG: PAS domain S-box protein, partial [Rhizomicrobium sp.]